LFAHDVVRDPSGHRLDQPPPPQRHRQQHHYWIGDGSSRSSGGGHGSSTGPAAAEFCVLGWGRWARSSVTFGHEAPNIFVAPSLCAP
jgi:hypothetical protein